MKRQNTRQGHLWYRQPAAEWLEALPLGNGNLGAMLYGGIAEETIGLNVDTLWSGHPREPIAPRDPSLLENIRSAVLQEDDLAKAEELCRQWQGPFTQSYLPLGSLHIHGDTYERVQEYSRNLDLLKGLARIEFGDGLQRVYRECFVSAVDQVLVYHWECSEMPQNPVQIGFSTPLRAHALTEAERGDLHNEYAWLGRAPVHVTPSYWPDSDPIRWDSRDGFGMWFATAIHVQPGLGGTCRPTDDGLVIENCREFTLLVAAETSYQGHDTYPTRAGRDPLPLSLGRVRRAAKKGIAELRESHCQEHSHYMSRVDLHVGSSSEDDARVVEMPVDQRLRRVQAGEQDVHLETLLFQYGRYLLFNSSRPGTLPANLQGIWNQDVRPPWSSNWTTNINLQMNYWPAEVTNLSECHQPLFDLLATLAKVGKATAANLYNCRGFVVHHNSDIWATTHPMGDGNGEPQWSMWPMAGAWLCAHLWEHYRFHLNENFLETTAYPLMRSAAEFVEDWLTRDPDGQLVTCPSTSPENQFYDHTGQPRALTAASTMDMAIIRELLGSCCEAARTLQVDEEQHARWQRLRDELSPGAERGAYLLGEDGEILEWREPYREVEPGHRHMSHLYGLYPGSEIDSERTPEWSRAAEVSLRKRMDAGGGHTGWSRAWLMAFSARLQRADSAADHMQAFLRGSTLSNLFGTHPPFQIDGNFGYTAGIAEMLLQSHRGYLHLLPSCPHHWTSGKVSGLRARGNFIVDMEWNDGRLRLLRLRSGSGRRVTIRVSHLPTLHVAGLGTLESEAGYFSWDTEPGGVYEAVAGPER